ncbi:MAG: hypothetical protein GYA36_21270 [Veillonellaceae bacterium]|nr:hypothetical protein [Veillonellaceae bacterium]
MPSQSFERQIVAALNDCFRRQGLRAVAYRNYQMKYTDQLFDAFVDSRGNELYMAIECKSVDTSTTNVLYWKRYFSWAEGVCQFQRETAWLDLSGRNGWLVVEARRGKGSRNSAFWVPWRIPYANWQSNLPGITSDQIISCPSIERQDGKYRIDDDFLERLISFQDSYPKDKSIVKRRKR